MTVEARADDWNDLAATWQADDVRPPIDIVLLRRHVALMRRRAMATMAGEVLLTLVFVAGALYAVLRAGNAWGWALAADVAAMVVAAWVFGLWNRRGTWSLAAETTEAYLALLRLRCRRRMQAAWFVWLAVLVQLASVTLASHLTRTAQRPSFISADEAIGLPAITVMVFLAAGARMYLRARRELRELADVGAEAI